MNDNKLAIVTPLILLVIMVTFAQVLIVPRWIAIQQTGPAAGQPKSGGLQVLGYNYNRDLVQISVTLWNRGSALINISGISYDGLDLKRGTVGSPNDLLAMANSSSKMVMAPGMAMGGSPGNDTALAPNDIVFPAADHWNMYTDGLSAPVMQPNGMATLYLGVSSTTPGSTHTLVITSGAQQYAFQLER